jgi:chromate reductase
MTVPLRLLGISGSLRRGSHSTALLHAVGPLLAGRAEFAVTTLHGVPLYDGDLDGDSAPDGVRRLRRSITEADGLILASPEYNYGMPGVLKNAIDWVSRPAFESPLKGKPTLIITGSPGVFGGVRAQAHIRDALTAALARPLVRPHVAVPAVDKKLVDGRIADEVTLLLVRSALDDLLLEIARPGR